MKRHIVLYSEWNWHSPFFTKKNYKCKIEVLNFTIIYYIFNRNKWLITTTVNFYTNKYTKNLLKKTTKTTFDRFSVRCLGNAYKKWKTLFLNNNYFFYLFSNLQIKWQFACHSSDDKIMINDSSSVMVALNHKDNEKITNLLLIRVGKWRQHIHFCVQK